MLLQNDKEEKLNKQGSNDDFSIQTEMRLLRSIKNKCLLAIDFQVSRNAGITNEQVNIKGKKYRRSAISRISRFQKKLHFLAIKQLIEKYREYQLSLNLVCPD